MRTRTMMVVIGDSGIQVQYCSRVFISKTMLKEYITQSQSHSSAAHPLFTSRQTVSYTQSGNLAIRLDHQYHCNLLNASFIPMHAIEKIQKLRSVNSSELKCKPGRITKTWLGSGDIIHRRVSAVGKIVNVLAFFFFLSFFQSDYNPARI